MRILIVEDQDYKAEKLVSYLENRNLNWLQIETINSALRYITSNKGMIDGIILDLGLKRFPKSGSIDPYGGLAIPDELMRLKIDIPILVCSNQELESGSLYEGVIFGQIFRSDDSEGLDEFISHLEAKKEQ